MKVETTPILGLITIQPEVHEDDRGYFFEAHNDLRYRLHDIGPFVQDNVSVSEFRVVRGLHYQVERPQAKLVSVLRGKIFDVAVDIRVGSPTFGKWEAVILSESSSLQFYIPEGFAHGFMAIEEGTIVHYKCTDYYSPQNERTINYLDPDIRITWPDHHWPMILSKKDLGGKFLRDIKDLPSF